MALPVSQCLNVNMFFLEPVVLVGKLGQRNHSKIVRKRLISQIVRFLLCGNEPVHPLAKIWKHGPTLVTIHDLALTQSH